MSEPANALCAAARASDLAAVRAALAAGADINQRNQAGDTALNIAAANGEASIVLTLIGAGADLESCGRNATTALMAVALAGRASLARMLIAAGALISDDLLERVATKSNQAKGRAELGAGFGAMDETWHEFLAMLRAARLRQDASPVSPSYSPAAAK